MTQSWQRTRLGAGQGSRKDRVCPGACVDREVRWRARPGRGSLAKPVIKERGPCEYIRAQLLNGEAVWKDWFLTGGSGTR